MIKNPDKTILSGFFVLKQRLLSPKINCKYATANHRKQRSILLKDSGLFPEKDFRRPSSTCCWHKYP